MPIQAFSISGQTVHVFMELLEFFMYLYTTSSQTPAVDSYLLFTLQWGLTLPRLFGVVCVHGCVRTRAYVCVAVRLMGHGWPLKDPRINCLCRPCSLTHATEPGLPLGGGDPDTGPCSCIAGTSLIKPSP